MTEPTNSTWVNFPQPGQKYVGRFTESDPSTVPDTAATAGQNTFDFNGDAFGIRPFGLSLFPSGTPSVASGGYVSVKTFRLRTGENILLGARGTVLEWFDQVTDTFANLVVGTSSADYGFAEFNVNADAESRVYFGNGEDNFMYWNGGHTNLDGALAGGESTINVDSTSSFTTTGSLIIGSTTVTYSGVTATSFTGCSGTPAATDGLAIAQSPIADAAAPKGNIYMAAQNRLFIVPSNNSQLVLFSAYGDASTWSTNTVLDSTATSAGAFNLIEGGGSVVGMVQDEERLYFIKDALIYAATLSDSFYTLQTLKPFDGKSRATGAVGKRGVFIGGNFIFIVTPDNQVKALQRMETIDFPQLKPISFVIQPDCDGFDFSSTTGITFRDYAYFACKSSSVVSSNDVVLAFNLVENHWENPIVGWSVGEWSIYDDGTGESLYFGEAVSPNIWKVVTTEIVDGTYPITAFRSTKQYDFGSCSTQKELDDVYIEGYISLNTSLTIELLLDEDGFTGTTTTNFLGSESSYIFDSNVVNAFGNNEFGVEVFGSNADTSGLQKFRIHLSGSLRRKPFYNCQLRFTSSGKNNNWKIIKYGFLVRQHSQPTRTSLIRNFT